MGHFKGKIGNAHARYHVTGWWGVIRNHIFGISDPNLPFHYISLYGATTTIKGSLHGSTPIVKRFSVEIFLSPVKIGPKNGGFSGITGCKC